MTYSNKDSIVASYIANEVSSIPIIGQEKIDEFERFGCSQAYKIE